MSVNHSMHLLRHRSHRRLAVPLFALLLFVSLPGCKKETEKKKEPGVHLKAIAVFVKGMVTIENRNNDVVHAGDVLEEGDRIQTGANSLLDLSLTDASIVRLRPGTALTISEIVRTVDGITKIDLGLRSGSTLHEVEKMGEKDSYTVRSPTAVASVRGTTFEFNAEENKSVVRVARGLVEVKSLVGEEKTHTVNDDHSITITAEKDILLEEPKSIEKLTPELQEIRKHLQEMGMDSHRMAKELASIKTEEDLKRVYKQNIEIIYLRDGRVLRGVVVGQEGGRLLVHTTGGATFIKEADVERVKYVTETVEKKVR